MSAIKLFPSLIDAPFLSLASSMKNLEPWCDGFHVDVMDGHFVPSLTWGPPVVNQIAKATHLPVQVHLMVQSPERLVHLFEIKSIDTLIFHAVPKKRDLVFLSRLVKNKGVRCGVALSPDAALGLIDPVIDGIDLVLLMSVEPGASGQPFLPSSFKKIRELIVLRTLLRASFEICVDGGVSRLNIAQLVRDGVDACAVGSAIFRNTDPVAACKELIKISENAHLFSESFDVDGTV